MTDSIATLALLVGLELVLGVDNILVISLFVGKLPQRQRQRTRFIGLTLALITRIAMLFILIELTGITVKVLGDYSLRDLVLIGGGLFLLFKAVKEIHSTVELHDENETRSEQKGNGFTKIIVQIIILDLIFSIDSVITAIGMTDQIWIIVSSVLVSFAAMLAYAKAIGEFIIARPTIKILALAFLVTIAVTIFLEGIHHHLPRTYIYLPMGFALVIELLQLRYEKNRRDKRGISDTL